MRSYDIGGLQLWTFPSGYGVRKDGKRRKRKNRVFLNWNPADIPGMMFITRKEAASILRTVRPRKTLDQ